MFKYNNEAFFLSGVFGVILDEVVGFSYMSDADFHNLKNVRFLH